MQAPPTTPIADERDVTIAELRAQLARYEADALTLARQREMARLKMAARRAAAKETA